MGVCKWECLSGNARRSPGGYLLSCASCSICFSSQEPLKPALGTTPPSHPALHSPASARLRPQFPPPGGQPTCALPCTVAANRIPLSVRRPLASAAETVAPRKASGPKLRTTFERSQSRPTPYRTLTTDWQRSAARCGAVRPADPAKRLSLFAIRMHSWVRCAPRVPRSR